MEKVWVYGSIFAVLVAVVVYLWAQKTGRPNPERWAAGGVIVTLLITWAISFFNKKEDEKSR